MPIHTSSPMTVGSVSSEPCRHMGMSVRELRWLPPDTYTSGSHHDEASYYGVVRYPAAASQPGKVAHLHIKAFPERHVLADGGDFPGLLNILRQSATRTALAALPIKWQVRVRQVVGKAVESRARQKYFTIFDAMVVLVSSPKLTIFREKTWA